MKVDTTKLDERSRDVLASVVHTYIRSASPVSSRQLEKSGTFGLSSASLRNAMADLEDLGFLMHPHVSAGRIPTDRGYRAFVDELMTPASPTGEERARIAHDLGSESFEMGRFLLAASRILSSLTGEVAVVSAPDTAQFVLSSVHFTRLSERKVLAVQVSEAGLVDSRLIETREDYPQAELDRVSRILSIDYKGHSLVAISRALLEALTEEKVRFDAALSRTLELGRLAFSLAGKATGEVYVEGTETLLEKPDFGRDLDSLRRMFRAFDEKARLMRLLTDCLDSERSARADLALDSRGTAVVIGSESELTGETQSAVVATAYGRGGRTMGVLGVIGPKRMAYARVVPLVRELGFYVTALLEGMDPARGSEAAGAMAKVTP